MQRPRLLKRLPVHGYRLMSNSHFTPWSLLLFSIDVRLSRCVVKIDLCYQKDIGESYLRIHFLEAIIAFELTG